MIVIFSEGTSQPNGLGENRYRTLFLPTSNQEVIDFLIASLRADAEQRRELLRAGHQSEILGHEIGARFFFVELADELLSNDVLAAVAEGISAGYYLYEMKRELSFKDIMEPLAAEIMTLSCSIIQTIEEEFTSNYRLN